MKLTLAYKEPEPFWANYFQKPTCLKTRSLINKKLKK